MATIQIPATLARFTNQQNEITLKAKNLADLLATLISQYPQLQPFIFAQDGGLTPFVSFYLNDLDIRKQGTLESISLTDNDILTLVPALAGG